VFVGGDLPDVVAEQGPERDGHHDENDRHALDEVVDLLRPAVLARLFLLLHQDDFWLLGLFLVLELLFLLLHQHVFRVHRCCNYTGWPAVCCRFGIN